MCAALPGPLRSALDTTLRSLACRSPAPFGDNVTHVVRCKVAPPDWRNDCQGVAETAAEYVADNLSVEWRFHRLSLCVERASSRTVRLRCIVFLRSQCLRLEVIDDHLGDQI